VDSMTPQGQSGLLVAYDDTPAARRAAEFAVERAAMRGEPVHVVHIGDALSESDIRDALGETFAERGVVLTVEIVPAGGSEDENVSVSRGLADAIDANDYAMVVMGNERHGLFHGLTEASVSEALIEDQTVPILLVP